MAQSSQQGDYEIVGPLGDGGMSFVYHARDPAGRDVVIKKLRPQLAKDPRVAAAFVREARLSEQLNHENVVRVIDTSHAESEHWIVLELISGTDVATFLEVLYDRDEMVPYPVIASIFRDLCAALAAAHALGIVHRDVTAGNVMVGWDGRAKLMDFGIAKTQSGPDQRLTRTGTTKGTLAYMAPEQVLAVPSDHRVDVYAATMVLYEMITRFNPYLGETDFETMSRVVEVPLPPLSELRPDAPGWLNDVCQKGLFRDPERRYQDMMSLRATLDRLLGTTADVRKSLAPLRQQIESYQSSQRVAQAEEPPSPPPLVVQPKPIDLPAAPVDPLRNTMRSIPIPPELRKKT